jgi:hypothetical protein
LESSCLKRTLFDELNVVRGERVEASLWISAIWWIAGTALNEFKGPCCMAAALKGKSMPPFRSCIVNSFVACERLDLLVYSRIFWRMTNDQNPTAILPTTVASHNGSWHGFQAVRHILAGKQLS